MDVHRFNFNSVLLKIKLEIIMINFILKLFYSTKNHFYEAKFMSKNNIVVVFHSGYGHTKKQAEYLAQGAGATLVEINADGDITEAEWDLLDKADGIVFGAPTYMGMASWQFKKFADTSSKRWFHSSWKDKVFGGFTNSASFNGDKQNTITFLLTLAMQHGGIWVSLGLMPSNTKAATRQDLNNLGSSIGAFAQSPSDCSVDEIPQGDLDTAKSYGERIAATVKRLK
jgi:NAD(P)H dehydrogenase (quinone)